MRLTRPTLPLSAVSMWSSDFEPDNERFLRWTGAPGTALLKN